MYSMFSLTQASNKQSICFDLKKNKVVHYTTL